MFEAWLKKMNLDNIPISSFSIEHTRRFCEDLRSGKVTALDTHGRIKNHIPCGTTFNSYVNMFENVWNWVENNHENILNKNPWKKIEALPEVTRKNLTYTSKQRETIFNELLLKNETVLYVICRMIYKIFIRPGNETRFLQVQDVNLIENKIWIEGDISKNRKTQWVPLPEDLKEELLKIGIENVPGEYYIFGKRGPSKYPVSRDYWSKKFTAIVRGLGISKGLTLYSFKHTGNQVAHLNKMPLMQQKDLNRHHSLDQMNTYLEGMRMPDADDLKVYIPD